jgi:hypothetical protein
VIWSCTAREWFDRSTGEPAADMSVDEIVTAWFSATRIGDPASMTASWPATGAAVGLLTLESTNDPAAGRTDEGETVDLSALYSETPEPHPDATAGSKSILIPQPALKFRWAYSKISGGEGAVCTVHLSGND